MSNKNMYLQELNFLGEVLMDSQSNQRGSMLQIFIISSFRFFLFIGYNEIHIHQKRIKLTI